MIISNSAKYIFIHIPKCAGTTVSHTLANYLRAQDVSIAHSPHTDWAPLLRKYKESFGLEKHSPQRDVEKAIGYDRIGEYTFIAFSRNPFARIVSAFNFTLKSDAKFRPDCQRHQDMLKMTFEDFLESSYVRDLKLYQVRPQSWWLRDSRAETTVYKVEDIDTALPDMIERFHRPAKREATEVRRINASSSGEDWRNISEKARRRICETYAEDFERFGYPRDLT